MFKILLSFIVLLFSNMLFSQDLGPQYIKDTNTADSLFLQKDYKNASELYAKAFTNAGDLGKVAHRYKAAACLAMLSKKDDAFIQLFRIATKGKFSEYSYLIIDNKFVSLHDDPRWEELITIVKAN